MCHYCSIETKSLCMFSNYLLVTRLSFGSRSVSVYVFRQPSKPIFKTTESGDSLKQSLDRQFSLCCCCLFIYTEKGMNTTPEIWSTWLVLILGRAWEREGSDLTWVVQLDVWSYRHEISKTPNHPLHPQTFIPLRIFLSWIIAEFQFSSSFSDLHCLFRMPVLFFF